MMGNELVTPSVEVEQGRAQERERLRDTRRMLVMRGLRSFAYGLLAVLLGVALAGEGFTPVAIGALITVSLVGDMVGTYMIGLFADTWGRRRTLTLLALLMAATGIIFGLVTRYPVLLVTAFFGTLGTSASETAPFLPIDQTMIAQVTAPERRTAVFARYNLVASFSAAAGALAAGLPGLLTRTGLPLISGVRLMFGVYAVLALIVAGLSLRLSSDVEAPPHHPVQAHSRRSRLVPPHASLTWHRVAADGTLQRGCAGWRAGGAELDSALLSRALRRSAHDALRPVLWGQSPLGALISGSGAARAAFRSAQHNGVHAPALKYPLDPGGLRAHVSYRGCAAALAPGAVTDGCPHPASLHDGSGRPGRAHSGSQRDFPGPQRGLLHQPVHFWSAAARTPARPGLAVHPGRNAQSSVRPHVVDRLPACTRAGGRGSLHPNSRSCRASRICTIRRNGRIT